MNILIFGFLTLGAIGTTNLQLVNLKSGFVVMEQKEGKIIFHDPILEDSMRETGVVIPPELQEAYGDRDRVKLEEENFFKAFKELYSSYIYDSDLYEWKATDSLITDQDS
jgi:hypothetical protein